MRRKYVVLAVNENPKYLYFWPIVVWAWRTFDWEPLIFTTVDTDNKFINLIYDTHDKMMDGSTAEMKILYKYKVHQLTPINGYKSETITQVSRLYAACLFPGTEEYLMTSDFDMIPLNEHYWSYEGHRVISYGRNLSNEHFPICYVGAKTSLWRYFMGIQHEDYMSHIKMDLDKMSKKTNPWLWDQDLLTKRLYTYGTENINMIDRNIDPRTNYPVGRVDRSNWRVDHPQLIDCHAPHDMLTNEGSFHNVLSLLHKVWPKHDLKWVVEYHKEFKKLL